MKTDAPDLLSDLERRLDIARFLYRELSNQLRDSIERLREGRETPGDFKERQSILRQHSAQLQLVLDLEGRLDNYTALTGGAGFDLAAARDEICMRLARLRATGGGGRVSG